MIHNGVITCDGCHITIDQKLAKVGRDYMPVWKPNRYKWRFVVKWGYHEHRCYRCGWPKSATVEHSIADAIALLTATDRDNPDIRVGDGAGSYGTDGE